jgi:tRNA(Ile)-lysidine synthase
MDFGAAVLGAVLEETLPIGATGLLVGVSGGADSACLSTALARLRAESQLRGLPLRAVHIDHGLQSASGALREASAALCGRLQIPLSVIAVAVDAGAGDSLEAAARTARYRGFALELGAGECLLTAHHAEDQAETLLLQALRGAGLKGLSAMPMCRPFAGGWHLRPLLNVTQRELHAFGEAHGVTAVEDPMNRDPRFDRSYVRAYIWPKIVERWPGAATALTRTARHLADAQELLDQSALRVVQRLRDGEALSVAGMRALPERERVNALRHWLAAAEIAAPSTSRLAEALRQMLTAESDHLPAIVWGQHALRRYQERLFVTPAQVPSLPARQEWRVAPGARLELGPGLGALRWTRQIGGLDAARLPETLSVRRRSGGETLKLGVRAKTQSVQHLCQSMGVLPWMRDALPMVYADETLIAIGDIWQDARWSVAAHEQGVGCVWEDAPVLA